MPKKYSFVLDADGKQLDPTIEQNAWRLVRQKKARLVSKIPMIIQLNKIVENPNQDEIRCGIDDGTNHVGISLVQKCQTRNKVLFKGVIEQRKYVKHLMDVRRGYRRYRRYHKWYRFPRFNNRASSKRIGKTHSNDAVCITNLKPENIDVEEWTIKPMRRKGKARTGQVSGFRHRDLVTYTYRNGETHTGYVTALYPDKNQLNFQSPTKHCKRVNTLKTKLLWRFNKIYWLKCL